MKVRYKSSGEERSTNSFNTHAMFEVLTGDDSCFVSSLDVYLEQKQEWQELKQASRTTN